MKYYTVIVTRDCTESTYVDVKARTRQEALALAENEAQQYPARFDWVVDDASGQASTPYLGDSSLNAATLVRSKK